MIKTIDPTRESFRDEIARVPQDAPVVMLNLLKFRPVAAYANAEENMSGYDAFAKYLECALPHLETLGAETIWLGDVRGCLIAPPEEKWDRVFLVRYPSIDAFKALLKLPEYRACTFHRTAALEDSRLICTIERPL